MMTEKYYEECVVCLWNIVELRDTPTNNYLIDHKYVNGTYGQIEKCIDVNGLYIREKMAE
ncbi:MAG: hypothetical protein ABIF18_03795 [archaeon]